MGFEVPLDDIDVSKVGDDFERVKAGKYHVQVNDVKFENKEKDGSKFVNMVTEFEVLNGTQESEIGKTFKDYCKMAGGSIKRALKIALATKITTEEELESLKKKGRGFSGWEDMVGRQCCLELAEEIWQVKDGGDGKPRTKLGFGIWAIGSEHAKGIPLNNGMLQQAAAGGGSVDPFGGDVSGATAGDSGNGDKNGSGNAANADPFAGVNFG